MHREPIDWNKVNELAREFVEGIKLLCEDIARFADTVIEQWPWLLNLDPDNPHRDGTWDVKVGSSRMRMNRSNGRVKLSPLT